MNKSLSSSRLELINAPLPPATASDPMTCERTPSWSEEWANALSHGIALIAAIFAAPLLISHSLNQGHAGINIGVCVFAGAMILLYLTSTLYHATPQGRTKDVLHAVERGAIFLLIAGTYSPFTLHVLRNTSGWWLFGGIWLLAAAGVVVKAIDDTRVAINLPFIYIFMGWIVLIALRPLTLHLTWAGLRWLMLGGIAYTSGVAFYLLDSRLRYAHFIWHLFVIAGTVFHYLAVFWYAA